MIGFQSNNTLNAQIHSGEISTPQRRVVNGFYKYSSHSEDLDDFTESEDYDMISADDRTAVIGPPEWAQK